jgi:hypothetical protein
MVSYDNGTIVRPSRTGFGTARMSERHPQVRALYDIDTWSFSSYDACII